jgi:hypothetical protein
MIFMLAPVIDLEWFCRRNVREKTLDENYEIPIFVNRHNNKLVVLNSEFIRDFLENYKNVNLNWFNIPITYAFSWDKDELALPAETRNYLSNFKNSHFVEIKDCEHRISGEKFKNVLSEIINIIKC